MNIEVVAKQPNVMLPVVLILSPHVPIKIRKKKLNLRHYVKGII
jgi:hypothetical protein